MKSNDKGVPKYEIAVAKLVQNAKGNGLKWTKNTLYRATNGKPCDKIDAVRCCAVGAALLRRDTAHYSINANANDTMLYEYMDEDETGSIVFGDLVSLGYRLAMRD